MSPLYLEPAWAKMVILGVVFAGAVLFTILVGICCCYTCGYCCFAKNATASLDTPANATKEKLDNADPAHMPVENQAYEFTDSDVATAAAAAAAVDTTGNGRQCCVQRCGGVGR